MVHSVTFSRKPMNRRIRFISVESSTTHRRRALQIDRQAYSLPSPDWRLSQHLIGRAENNNIHVVHKRGLLIGIAVGALASACSFLFLMLGSLIGACFSDGKTTPNPRALITFFLPFLAPPSSLPRALAPLHPTAPSYKCVPSESIKNSRSQERLGRVSHVHNNRKPRSSRSSAQPAIPFSIQPVHGAVVVAVVGGAAAAAALLCRSNVNFVLPLSM